MVVQMAEAKVLCMRVVCLETHHVMSLHSKSLNFRQNALPDQSSSTCPPHHPLSASVRTLLQLYVALSSLCKQKDFVLFPNFLDICPFITHGQIPFKEFSLAGNHFIIISIYGYLSPVFLLVRQVVIISKSAQICLARRKIHEQSALETLINNIVACSKLINFPVKIYSLVNLSVYCGKIMRNRKTIYVYNNYFKNSLKVKLYQYLTILYELTNFIFSPVLQALVMKKKVNIKTM